MRCTAVVILSILALTAASCGGAQTPVSPTVAELPSETPILATPTPTIPLPTNTPSGPLGSISGSIRPVAPKSGHSGSMSVLAREFNLGTVTFVAIPEGQTTYTISGLPVGEYIVLGWVYPDGVTGAHTSTDISTVKTSMEQMKCNNSVVTIILEPSKMDVEGVDIGCWAGDFYALLTPIP